MDLEKREEARAARKTADKLSPARAEIISRAWQAVAFIEELRADLTGQVRESKAREEAAVAMTEAGQHLMIAAGMLVPRHVVPIRQRGIHAAHVPERIASRG